MNRSPSISCAAAIIVASVLLAGPVLSAPEVTHTPGGWPWAVVLDATESWENGAVHSPSVMYDQGKYRMWYTFENPINGSWAGGGGIGYAESDDGLNWTNKQLLISAQLSPTWHRITGNPKVIKCGATYYLYCQQWYVHDREDWTSAVSLRTSGDGINWSAPTLVLRTANRKPFERDNHYVTNVFHEPGGGFRMFYTCRYQINPNDNRLCTAYSPDGVDWSDRSMVLDELGQSITTNHYTPFIDWDAGQQVWRIYYPQQLPGGSYEAVGAYSINGVNWVGIQDSPSEPVSRWLQPSTMHYPNAPAMHPVSFHDPIDGKAYMYSCNTWSVIRRTELKLSPDLTAQKAYSIPDPTAQKAYSIPDSTAQQAYWWLLF